MEGDGEYGERWGIERGMGNMEEMGPMEGMVIIEGNREIWRGMGNIEGNREIWRGMGNMERDGEYGRR
jgi:hypothetical protein